MIAPQPDASALLDALEVTWPAAQRETAGDGLVLRVDSPEAGKRVRSARLAGPSGDVEKAAAQIEAFYHAHGGPALFQSARAAPSAAMSAEDPMEQALAARGFSAHEPCALAVADCAALAETATARAAEKGVHAVEIRTPLAILEQFWIGGGVGEKRQAVMRRALEAGASGGVLATRIDSRFQAAAFWAAAPDGLAFIHAIHVAPEARRRLGAHALLGLAGRLALEAGATRLCAATLLNNAPARALLARCGFTESGGYVYWRKAR